MANNVGQVPKTAEMVRMARLNRDQQFSQNQRAPTADRAKGSRVPGQQKTTNFHKLWEFVQGTGAQASADSQPPGKSHVH
jgi:hypothetical protein